MVLQEKKLFGICGSCRWRYKSLETGQCVLEITPLDVEEGGVLDKWEEFPPLCEVDFLDSVKKVMIACGFEVSAFKNMFLRFSGLTQVLVGGLKTDKVSGMSRTFCDCKSFDLLDVSGWNVSGVTGMGHMCGNCLALVLLDISKWNTSAAMNMHGIFSRCFLLATLDVSMRDVSKVINTKYMFSGCEALALFDASKWDMSFMSDMTDMFLGCNSLVSLDIDIRVSDEIDIEYMFQGRDLPKHRLQEVKNV